MSGVGIYCLYHELISIRISTPGFGKVPTFTTSVIDKKRITLFYWHKGHLKQEAKEIPWTSDTTANSTQITAHWLTLLDEEDILPKPIYAQSTAISQHNQELSLSLTQNPLETESSTYDKYQLISSLLQTLRTASIPTQNVRFLVDHLPLQDTHLDFSQPWPLQGFSSPASEQHIEISALTLTRAPQRPFTIMISAAGDAQRVGRTIGDSFERGIALQCAEGIVKTLQEAFPSYRVLLAKAPGAGMDDLHGASFANRLDANMFISLHCFEQTAIQRTLDIYYFSLHPLQDAYYKPDNELTLRSALQAYLPCYTLNKKLAYTFSHLIAQRADTTNLTIRTTLGLPFKPLLGLAVPAIACELGLQTKQDLQIVIPALCKVIQEIITTLTQKGSL